MSATYNKFNCFSADLMLGKHNLSTDTLVWFLTNSSPTSSQLTLGQITQVSYTNLSSRTVSVTTVVQSGGTAKLVIGNSNLTSSGAVGPFQYTGIANYTSATSPLICWFDRGAALTMVSGDTFALTSDQTNGIVTLV